MSGHANSKCAHAVAMCLVLAGCSGRSTRGAAATLSLPDAGGDAQQPAVGSACPTGNKPVDLTTEGAHAAGIAVDNQYVYFTDELDRVRKVPVCGGPVVDVALVQATPLGITVTAQHLFWVDEGKKAGTGQVVEASKDGMALSSIAQQLNGPWPIVHDANSVYFSATYGGVFSFPIAGGPVKNLADQAGGYACLALDDAYVYYADYHDVGRVPKSGGAAQLLTDQASNGWCVAVDNQWVYFTNYLGRLMRVAKTGGTPEALSPSGPLRYVTLDATDIYYTQDGYGGPAVLRIPKSGGKPQTLANGVQETGQIVVTDTALFWTDDAGLWRLDK